MAKSAPAGIMIAIAGVWVITQLWWGDSLTRLGL